MSFNPIVFANEVNSQFIRYQLSAFQLSDPGIADQVKRILSHGMIEKSPLFKGPYLSLSRAFAEATEITTLIAQGKLHPAMGGIIRFTKLFRHQQKAFEATKQGKHCLITTGAGSGKTEAFLVPIINYCLELRDNGSTPPGIVALIIYPMNALAVDQLERLREMLAGSNISFAMYVGSTPTDEGGLVGSVQLKQGEGQPELKRIREEYRDQRGITISPWEERRTREEIVTNPPRILLTNVNQLEFLMTRSSDIGLFLKSQLKFIVVDEAHTYSGAFGAEAACLLRRLRALCNKGTDDVICMATSATIVHQNSPQQPAHEFMNRLFGIDPKKIEIIAEEYDTIKWPLGLTTPPPPTIETSHLLNQILENIEKEDNELIMRNLVQQLTGAPLDIAKPWTLALYEQLKQNQLVKTIYEELEEPLYLDDAVKWVFAKIGRSFSALEEAKAELLCYLALGAIANSGEPLLRPKLHFFVRGLRGISAILEEEKIVANGSVKERDDGGQEENLDAEESSKLETPVKGIKTHPTIYFDANEALQANPHILPSAIFPVYSCMNCGQHYFEAWLDNVEEKGQGLSGGLPDGENTFWILKDEETATRFLFVDRFVSEDFEEDNTAYLTAINSKRSPAFICRFCGTIHKNFDTECHNPQCRKQNVKLLPIYMIKQKEKLASCPSCGYLGPRRAEGRLEPIRRLRAITVADIHILAQDLINAQNTDQKKLIIFSDNRQDAAFQAAWINQRARRYRFRHLLYSILKKEAKTVSIGDLVDRMYAIFEGDKQLSRYLAPEVYSTESDDAYSNKIRGNLKKFIRISFLLELTQAMKWQRNLEAWGLVKINYFGISDVKNDAKLTQIALNFGLTLDQIKQYIESLLDVCRRNYKTLYDPHFPIFEKFWHEGNEDIQHGFVPSSFTSFRPSGIALEKEENNRAYARALFSKRGRTVAQELALKSKIKQEKLKEFLEQLWDFLKDTKLLINVDLKSQKGEPLGKAVGLYHIDDQQIGLQIQSELYRCSICQRIHTRSTPFGQCTAYRCKGTLIDQIPSLDNYDIRILNQDFTMIVAREHTAQVPPKLREEYEKEFKSEKKEIKKIRVNCLVASPTLELGVDIGSLDVVLLRNVPPLPSNYWQRAGRAGRRHRMALIYTYCRQSIHDDYFFEDPLRMLAEKIQAPKFNLKNHIMIEKHVHATILSKFAALNHSLTLTSLETDLKAEVPNAFPKFLKQILFEGKLYRKTPYDLKKFTEIYDQYKSQFQTSLIEVFQHYWPVEAQNEVQTKVLQEYIGFFVDKIREIYVALFREFHWVLQTKKKLQGQEENGLLDDMQKKLLGRCKFWIYNIAQENLSNYLLSILSDRGFLPNYIGIGGNIVANVGEGYSPTWKKIDFELTRPALIALREFAPGNLIYANGGKYRTAFFHFPIKEETQEATTAILPNIYVDTYVYDQTMKRIFDKAQPIAGYSTNGTVEIDGIPISNLDLSFLTQISDDDAYRFRLACRIVGYLQNYHRGGRLYDANGLEIHHLYGQKICFVNLGPLSKEISLGLGFPICVVCGGTRSPFASKREIDHFIEHHEKKTCGQAPKNYALTTDAEVDCLRFTGFHSSQEAINYVEAIRMGATIKLEMNRDDLDLLLLPQSETEYDIILYDPMPGGSGLLSQIIERWKEIIDASLKALDCPNKCQKSCYVCMRTYRNILFHDEFDRQIAVNLIKQFSYIITLKHDIPAQMDIQTPSGTSTNWTEQSFRDLFVSRGFPSFDAQKEIKLVGSIPSTKPDFYYEEPVNRIRIAIYIDGLSKIIHGNADRAKIDKFIDQALETFHQIKVVRIPATAKHDPKILDYFLQQITNFLKPNYSD